MATPLASQILVAIGGGVLQKLGTVPWRKGLQTRGGEIPYTFTRADATTCATYIDYDGVIRLSSANLLRIEWVDLDGDGIRETPGILLEGGRTNAFTKSRKLDDAAYTKTACSITADATTGPGGAVDADKIVEDGTNAAHLVLRATPALTDSTVSSFYCDIAPAGRTWAFLRMLRKDNSVATVWYNLTGAGVVGTQVSNTLGAIQKLANGFYRCFFAASSLAGATPPEVRVGPTTGDAVTTYLGDGVSGIYATDVQFETDKAFPSSFIFTDASAVTRAADSLTLPFNFGPIPMTILARVARPVYADAAGTIGINAGVYTLASGSKSTRLNVSLSASRNTEAYLDDVTADSAATRAILAGTTLNYAVRLSNLTTAGVAALEDSGGSTVAGPGAPGFSAWATQVLTVGASSTGGGSELFGVLLDLILAKGLYSLSDMLGVAL